MLNGDGYVTAKKKSSLISNKKKPVDRVILHWYGCGADGRADGRANGRKVTWLQKFLGCIDNQIFLPMCSAARAPCAREVRYNGFKLVEMLCQEKMQRK